MDRRIDFISCNTKNGFIKMTVPILFAMILNMAYNLVDSLWIGNLLGETAFAALTSSTPVILILTSIAMGMTQGVTILLSRAIGSKDEMLVSRYISTSLVFSIVFSVVVSILFEININGILNLLNTPYDLLATARQYLSIYIWGYATVYLYCYFAAVLRSFGDSVFQALAMLLCTILNAIFDPILIHFLGLQGAAVATVGTQVLSLGIMCLYIKRKSLFCINLKDFDVYCNSSLIIKGVVSTVQQLIPAISTSILTSLVSIYGVTALASFGIISKLEVILFYPAMAINMALTSIIGQCIGGKRFDRAKSYMKIALTYGALLLCILVIIFFFFSGYLSRFFIRKYEIEEIVNIYFKIVGVGYILTMITNCFFGCLNGMGKPSKSLLCMIITYLLARLPLAWCFNQMLHSINGIWIGILLSHIIAVILLTVVVNREMIYLENHHHEKI